MIKGTFERKASEEKEVNTVPHTNESTIFDNQDLVEQYFAARKELGSLGLSLEGPSFRAKS